MATIVVKISVPPSPSLLTAFTIIQEEEQAVKNENRQPEMALWWEQELCIWEIKAAEHFKSEVGVNSSKGGQ